MTIISRTWDKVLATILDLEIETNHFGGNSETHNITTKYKYEIEGKSYESRTLYFGQNLTFFASTIFSNSVKKYPIGSTTIVYVNPIKKGQSVVENDIKFIHYFNLTVLIVLLLGINYIYYWY